MSGAGRSTVGNALEDLGWYVVDNLPPQMLGPISDLFTLAKTPLPRLAVIIDARGGEFFGELTEHLQALRSKNINLRLVFLEATDSALVKRFESVRRPHPLQGNGTITDGVQVQPASVRIELLHGLEELAGIPHRCRAGDTIEVALAHTCRGTSEHAVNKELHILIHKVCVLPVIGGDPVPQRHLDGGLDALVSITSVFVYPGVYGGHDAVLEHGLQ